MSQIVRLGRKYAIYLPKNIISSLNLKEGDKFILKVEGDQIILKPLPKFLKKRPVWRKTSIEEFEKGSEELPEEALK